MKRPKAITIRMIQTHTPESEARAREFALKSGVPLSNLLAALVLGLSDDELVAAAQKGNKVRVHSKVGFKEVKAKLATLDPEKLREVMKFIEGE